MRTGPAENGFLDRFGRYFPHVPKHSMTARSLSIQWKRETKVALARALKGGDVGSVRTHPSRAGRARHASDDRLGRESRGSGTDSCLSSPEPVAGKDRLRGTPSPLAPGGLRWTPKPHPCNRIGCRRPGADVFRRPFEANPKACAAWATRATTFTLSRLAVHQNFKAVCIPLNECQRRNEGNDPLTLAQASNPFW